MHLAQDFETLFTVASLISLLTLSVLEIVLGIDNIIFISIIAGKLPKELQSRARSIGLMLALIMRVLLLFSITWVISLKNPLFSIGDFHATGRDIILFSGGLFLIVKTVREIYFKIEGLDEAEETFSMKRLTLNAAILQIVLIDIVFSFDSILTAVGLVDNLLVMILAVIIAMLIMLAFSKAVSDFINDHPTVKMLALSFLVMIGALLILDGLHIHLPKEYVYVSIAFSLSVELLNMRMRKKAESRKTHKKD